MTDTFSIAVIPDTQILSARHESAFTGLTRWIADQADALNLKMVLHVGDVVNAGETKEEQYGIAQQALNVIHEADIPMLIAIGNHDYDNQVKIDRSSRLFNQYFGQSVYGSKPWFGATFEEGKSENSYAKLNIEGGKFIFVSLEFGPRDEVIDWCNAILRAHSDHEAIVMTHSYMYMKGERTKHGNTHNPKIYPGASGANDGEDLWHKSFKHHPNLIAVFSGHHIPHNLSYRIDLGESGNPVFQSFQNWQSAPNGGEGRLRIVKYQPSTKQLTVQVFNPLSGKYETEDGCELSVRLTAEQIGEVQFPTITADV
ncbi:hypothetical protein PAESOLCIP111_00228 [Paenibacillus solanacearum]|uniref:Calcineurin-like phosphoesterase domain-containing protein n=1 Tax=Paenibacillus solanacearum TaxID=2048548 RepID=A0A916JST4_9BACL|nr:metallophosphoesterase [Paenibacillus solanacearum]CAG7598465.1 hypothetical protein PAESOLCIP111_00228 [Paenibacillus solanacearum]